MPPIHGRTHGAELRARLLACAALWLVASVLVFIQKEAVLAALLHPLQGLPSHPQAQTTAVGELFFTYLKLAGWGGLVVVLPVVLWQVGAFLSPGLYKREKRWIYPSLLAVPVLFYGGALFAFTILVPLMLNYLLGFTQPEVLLQPRLADYIGFVVTAMLAVGGAFLLPWVLVVLMGLGLVQPTTLAAARRWVVVVVFVVAAVVTPPDPFSQTVLAVPMLLLYEIAILIGWRVTPLPKASVA